MAKYKPYNYSQTEMIPVSLEDQLMEGTLELAIHTLVEGRMGVSRFDARMSLLEIQQLIGKVAVE